MKFSFGSALVFALATESVVGGWFSKAVYNKWHETELERWLSDHDVPYPTPADRRDLENLVKSNWDSAVASPYLNWDTNRLQKQLEAQGTAIKKGTEKNKNELVKQVQATWTETSDSADKAYGDVRDWIFDTWSDSQLKAFADTHSIPVPQPNKRDSVLAAVRANYHSAAKAAGETAAYPGNWLYESWSDSDLKSWLDYHGIPAPQPGKRDKLIANVRRNARIASLNSQTAASQAIASAQAAAGNLGDSVFDSWSESDLKEWADKNGIKVPQGSTRNELLAIARKNVAKLSGDNVPDKAASAYGAATSSAGNEFASATTDIANQATNFANQLYSQAIYYADELQIALGLKTNLASSASRKFADATGGNYASSMSASANKAASSASSSASKASSSASKAASSAASSASKSASKSAQSAKAKASKEL